jgi:DNA-binding transcriptional LysR family regulator
MAGMGVSLLSLHTLSLELRSGEIALLDVNGTPLERTWQIVHLASKQLSPTCVAFRRFMLEHAEPFLEREYASFIAPQRSTALRAAGGKRGDAGAPDLAAVP